MLYEEDHSFNSNCFIVSSLQRIAAFHQPEFSTAGFFELPNSGREVFSMNPAWRFYKGSVAGAEAMSFDDTEWAVVSLPNGIEYLLQKPAVVSITKVKFGIVSTSLPQMH